MTGVDLPTSLRVREKLMSFEPGSMSLSVWVNRLGLGAEDGAGVRVALLDSGINWSNSAFSGAKIRGRDFTGSGTLLDPSSHGTSNAALLVAQNKHEAAGLCPGCELFVGKVLIARDREKTALAISRALRWSVGMKVDIIVLPLGSSRRDAQIERGVKKAVAAGILVLAAAGNRGPDQICFPAWMPEVIAVSALSNDGAVYPGCCNLPNVDVYLKGDRVPVGGLCAKQEVSGSSPATVLAAGVAALSIATDRRSSKPLTS